MTIYTKIAQSKENLLTIKKNCLQKSNFLRARISSKNCSQQKFAHRICLQHRKTAHNEKPCWLGWINTMAKCLASNQSEHRWCAPLNGLICNGWNVLGRTFQELPVSPPWGTFSVNPCSSASQRNQNNSTRDGVRERKKIEERGEKKGEVGRN